MELRKETGVDSRNSPISWLSFIDGLRMVSYVWTGFCAALFLLGGVMMLTGLDEGERVGDNTTMVFSSEYGGQIEVSRDAFIKGCVWEAESDDASTCISRWFYRDHLHRYYLPQSERRYPDNFLVSACVFVQKDNMSTCEPMWYERF